jgi:hypothetical protein
LAVVISIYLLASKRNHLSFEIFVFIFVIAVVALFGRGLFGWIKGLLLYAPLSNNSLIGFFIFAPVLIMLLVSTSYLLVQGITSMANPPFFRNHLALANFAIILAILLVFSAFLFMKNINVRPGNYSFSDGSMTKQEALLELSGNKFIYTLKEKNINDQPMNIIKIFGNKEEISLNNLALESAEMNDSKIIISPNSTAKIIIDSPTPIYVITIEVENQFPPQDFEFWK